jgi:hypothetical protein
MFPSNLWNAANLISDEIIPNIAKELATQKIGVVYPRRT